MVSGSLRATDSLLATTGIFDQSITIASQEAIPHLIFSRAHNYVCFPSGGSFRITAGTTVNAKKYCPLIIEGTVDSNGITTATNVYPGVSNKANLGLSSYKWANVYATTFTGDLSGNATTATTWQTSRTLTIGNKGQSVNGGSDVSWALNDILLNATQIGTATSWDQIGPSVYYVNSSAAFTGTNHPGNNSEQAPYTYGQLIVSRAGAGGILQIYAPHTGSAGNTNSGLRYRTGWNSAGWQVWSTILDDRLWRKYIFANKNIGRTTLTVSDSGWTVTSGTDVFGLAFKDTGLTYTPSGGSATASSDTGDWRAWLTCAADSNTVTLNMRIDGSWQAGKFIGPLQGNADTATKLATAGTTAQFYRGDRTWSSTINGGTLYCMPAASTDATQMAFNGGIQLREAGGVGNAQNTLVYAPRISFHWSQRIAKSISLHSDGIFYFRNQNGTDRSTIDANVIGNVTGNCSGSSGSCTGNAATATKATQDGSGNTITSTYLKLSGGTMTGALNLKNNTWNNVGDDCAMGDCNQTGLIGIKSLNNANRSGFYFYNSSGTALATLAATGSNLITVSNDLYATGYLQAGTYVYIGAGYHLEMRYNNTWWGTVYNHNNGNISLNAAGGGLYVGYLNCTGIYLYTNGTQRGYVNANGIYGAVWNDFAEFRKSTYKEPGRVVIDDGKGCLQLCNERLTSGARIISDTYGMSVGYSTTQDTPIGIGGRVLVYPYQNRNNYKVGDAVCSAPNGTVDIMTRDEIKEYPERIIGIVSEIPDYEIWKQQAEEKSEPVSVKVKGRIWIYVK